MFMFLLASFALAATDRVCVFDIDGTVLNGVDENNSRAAIQACKDAGYPLAVNTAETWDECQGNKWRLEELGLVCPDEVYTCLSDPDWGTSKTQNMDGIAAYYGSSKSCTILFDDNWGNINAVSGAGYAAQVVNQEAHGAGISTNELYSGIGALYSCQGDTTNVCYTKLAGGIPKIEGNEVGSSTGGSLQSCQMACTINSQCKSFVYTSNWGAQCFLKDKTVTSSTPVVANKDYSAYYPTECKEICYAKLDGGLPTNEGNGVGSFYGGSLDQCKQSCTQNSECKSLTYTTSYGKQCFLKDRQLSPDVPTTTNREYVSYYQIDCRTAVSASLLQLPSRMGNTTKIEDFRKAIVLKKNSLVETKL